jgi:glycogen(starch) synthase
VSHRRILLTTDVVGGVWDFCLTLTAGLRGTGDDVVLLAFGSPDLSQRHAAGELGAQLISVPLKLEWMHDADEDVEATPGLVEQVARRVGADAVHANQFAAACVNLDIPVILTLHSDVLSWRRWTLHDDSIPQDWRSYHALVQRALTAADRVVAVSRFLAHETSRVYGISRTIDVVHNGWSSQSYAAPGARERVSLVAGRVWDAAKNVPLVAQAAAGWNPGDVFLAGETAHPDGGEAGVPEPLQPVGFLARDDLDALMRRARVYVSAARYDPFGLLPLQAALQGCMLLLSDIPAYREVWGDAATFFRSDDPDDLRARWQRLLEQDSDTRAFEHARTNLTAKRMVDSYRELYGATVRAVAA